MADGPLVSVILPVYNRASSVGRSIESVLNQTYRAFELIVIDDGSTDGTLRVLETFGSRIRVLRQDHAGAYVARNLGIRSARGELLAFIDSDDVWLPAHLSVQVPLMGRPEVGLVFGDAIHVTPRARTKMSSFRVSPPSRGKVAGAFVWSNFVPTTTVLVRRRCMEEMNGFPLTSGLSEDYLAWFRIALRHELDYVESPVSEYMVHSDGMSADLGRSIEARIHLFSAELAGTSDGSARALLRHLNFNLSLHLVLAALRGRAGNVDHPLRLARRTALGVASFQAGVWIFRFAMHQARIRTRRLFR